MNNFTWKILAVLALALVVSGCGPGGPTVYQAGGTVNYNSKPIEGAHVTFVYEDGNFASGVTDAAGKFLLTLPNNPKGAPAGKCTVSVAKVDIAKGKALPPEPKDVKEAMKVMIEQKEKMEKEGPPKSAIPTKYASTTSSGLTFEVKPNNTDNNFVIDLKD